MSAGTGDPLALPFDVYQRYRLVVDVLGRLRAEAARRAGDARLRLRVLDVGGRTAVLRSFDRDDDVALVDIEPLAGVPGLVQGDGARLPFRDRSFDAVCAFDTLEHVPPPARDAFVGECARVARSYVVLAGPYDAPLVVRAEELLQRFLREKLATTHRYLEEHRHNGLPDRARVEARLRAAGGEVRSLGHANLERWLAFLCVAMYLDLEPGLRGLAESLFRFYNEHLYKSDHAEPVYRHAVIAALGGAPLPDLAGLLDPPVAPRGALAPFAELGRELLAFDRVRGEWRAEEGKLRETIAVLEQDLLGHAGALADERRTVKEKDLEIEARDERIRILGAERDAVIGRADALDHLAAARGVALDEALHLLDEHRTVLAARDAQVADQRGHIGNLEAHLRDRNAELKRWPMAALRRVMWLFFGRPPTA